MRRSLCGLRQLSSRLIPKDQRCVAAASASLRIISTRHPVLGEFAPKHKNEIVVTHDHDDVPQRAQSYSVRSTSELRRLCGHNLSKVSEFLSDDTHSSDSQLIYSVVLFTTQECCNQGSLRRLIHALRFAGVSLDADDGFASSAWLELLKAVASSKDRLRLLGLMCKRNGIAWNRPKLFAEVIGTIMAKGYTNLAMQMSRYLRKDFDDESQLVVELYDFYSPKGTTALNDYFLIHAELGRPAIWSTLVPRIVQTGRFEDALHTHLHLLRLGDGPSTFNDVKPFLLHFAETGQDPMSFLSQLKAAGYGFGVQGQLVYETSSPHYFSPNSQSVSDVPTARMQGTNKISDGFAATAFATRGLPFEFLMNSLQALGLTEIGPRSIRTIGVAAGDLDTLRERLTLLSDSGIDTGGSSYSRIVQKLCASRSHFLLKQVLDTDMHHDVFEDRYLQQRLLISNVRKSNWRQVNLLTLMLNQGNIHQLQQLASSSLLRSFLQDKKQRRAYARLISQSTSLPTTAQFYIIDEMIREMRTDRVRKVARSRQRAQAEHVLSLMQQLCTAGGHFDPFHWRHVMSRLGSTGPVRTVLALLQWLAQHTAHADTITPGNKSLLHRLLTPQFQAGLVNWTLRMRLLQTEREVIVAVRQTLFALKRLEDEHDVVVDLAILQKTIVMRCRGRYPLHVNARSDRHLAPRRPRQTWRLCYQLLEEVNRFWQESTTTHAKGFEIALSGLQIRRKRRYRPSLWSIRRRDRRRASLALLLEK